MNQENLQQDETDIEVKNKSEVVSVEHYKNSQEFTDEILGKIENDFKSAPDNKEEIEKTENSILLENQSLKNEIKEGLDLDNKLQILDFEANNLKKNTKSKISEITGLGEEAQLELSEFSKRYSAFYRDQIAEKIKNLRFQYQAKHKEKPIEIDSLKTSIKSDVSNMGEIQDKKINDEELLKNLEEQKKKLNLEIEELKNTLNKRKNSFIYKIQERFISNKFSEETFEVLQSEGMTKESIKNKLYQKDFEMFQAIESKKNNLEEINTSIQSKENNIKEKDVLLEKLQTSIEDKYKLINEIEKIINSDFEIKEIEKTIVDFWGEMAKQKRQIEAETKERSVFEISKEKGVLFCHSIPLEVIKDTSFSQNNPLVKTNEFGPEEKIKMILGVEPTISVSTINKENQKLVGGFGLILNEGQVLSSYAGDAGTLLDKSIYNRRSKYDRELKTSIIQPDIENNLNFAINHLQKRDLNSNSSVETMHQGWNELVVENPQVAGLFFQKDNPNSMPGDFNKAKKISKQLNLPLYILDKDKIYQMDEEINELRELNKEDIFNSPKSLSKIERKNLIEEMVDKESFNIKKENIYQFNGYNVGKAYYRFMKRVDAGEKIYIKSIGDDENLENKNEIIHLFDESYVIKKIELTEKQWELFGNDDWEKHGTYHASRNDSEYNFNSKFRGQLVWEPCSKFVMKEGDSISSYIEMAERELERLKNQDEEVKKRNESSEWTIIHRKSISCILLGFAEECRKNNDNKNYEKALKLIEKFGNIKEYDDFVKKRVGQDGKFQYLSEDIPVEVRKKIKDLEK